MPLIFRKGIIAITRTITPIPPIQCVSARQNKILLGRTSISVKIDEPVVVKPEIDSKKASVNVEIECAKRYGKVPNTPRASQLNVTISTLSLSVGSILRCIRVIKFRTTPDEKIVINAIKICSAIASLFINEITTAVKRNKLSITITMEIRWRINPIFTFLLNITSTADYKKCKQTGNMNLLKYFAVEIYDK